VDNLDNLDKAVMTTAITGGLVDLVVLPVAKMDKMG
jgi:hypothetical protein